MTCSYIKRRTDGMNWEEEVDDETVAVMSKIVEEMRRQAPVSLWV